MVIHTNTNAKTLHGGAEMFNICIEILNKEEENRGKPRDFSGFAGGWNIFTGVEL